jgi:hypothetical protein
MACDTAGDLPGASAGSTPLARLPCPVAPAADEPSEDDGLDGTFAA